MNEKQRQQRENIIREVRKEVDENATYPHPDTRKKLMRYAPRVYEAFFGRRYIVPKYRESDYFKQDFLNYIDWAGAFYYPISDPNDEIVRTAFACNALSLHLRRPTLFLERELGEPLIRSQLPMDMMAEDIKWKWEAFRVYLPKHLITIQRENHEHSLMYLDIARVDERGGNVPGPLAVELDAFLEKEHPDLVKGAKLSDFKFFYKEPALLMAGMIEKGPVNAGLTTYGLVKPFSKYTLEYISNIHDELNSEWKRDDIDNVFLDKMELLTIQILLFLSAYPLEYDVEKHVIRKPRLEGKHQISGLYPAKFVGQSQIRPAPGEAHHVARSLTHEEWHLRRHWRAGHWRRVVFGPGRADRKLLWINPYQAGYEEEEETGVK